MKYVFEWGWYPNVNCEKEINFVGDSEAINYAKEHDVDYVWTYTKDTNPREVYKKKGRGK